MLPAFFEREDVINVDEYLVSSSKQLMVVQTNLSKIKRIDPRSSPPSFLEPLRYVGDGDRYLMETQQECEILARLQMSTSCAADSLRISV